MSKGQDDVALVGEGSMEVEAEEAEEEVMETTMPSEKLTEPGTPK